MMLEVRGLRSGYAGGPDVLDGITVEMAEREIVALVGLNGAGKSTLVKSICGLLPTRGGTITFRGDDVTATAADARVRLGLMLVPEGRELFPTMSVGDTLRLGTYALPRAERVRRAKAQEETVFGLFPVLAERRKQAAGTLSGGEQQMLAIARALMSDPRLLVLDEPSLGLAPMLIETIFAALRVLNEEGLTILLVEQNASFAIDVSSRAYLMELGRIVGTSSTEDLRNSKALGDLISGADTDAKARDIPALAAHIPQYTTDASRRAAAR